MLEHLPPFLRKYDDFIALATAYQSILEQMDDAQRRMEDDLYVVSAGQRGLSRATAMLELPVVSNEDMEVWRRRILSRIRLNTPFTLNRFMQTLEDIVPGALITVELKGFVLRLHFSSDHIPHRAEIVDLVSRVVPANLSVQITGL